MDRTAAEPNATLLIVDTEPYMVDVCTRTLQRAGYAIVGTSDPHDALRALHSGQRFDLLLAAHIMPIRGQELARLARAAQPTIGVIIMTGGAPDDVLDVAIQRAEVEHISKPFELDALTQVVAACLAKTRRINDP
jgi:DNA-binding NtrC family response regulator